MPGSPPEAEKPEGETNQVPLSGPSLEEGSGRHNELRRGRYWPPQSPPPNIFSFPVNSSALFLPPPQPTVWCPKYRTVRGASEVFIKKN